MSRAACNAPCNPPCPRPIHGHGLCAAHRDRQRRGQRLDTPIGGIAPRACTAPCEPPCTRDVLAKGLCSQHYKRRATGQSIDTPILARKQRKKVGVVPPPTPPPDWRDSAACAGQDTDRFFPRPGDVEGAQWALAWCKACPVVDECLQAHLAVEPIGRDMRHGIYGGTTPLDRYRAWLNERARVAA